MKGVFITGTGTGVGKTYVAGLLLKEMRGVGTDAITIKPVQTGCTAESPMPDLEEHWRIAGWRPGEEEARRMSPFCFRDPVSPHLAARREGRELRVAEIAEKTREAGRGHAFAIVEGAGGILVPLNDTETMLDLAVALGLPVWVVAEAGLGTINHSLLTVGALRGAGLAVATVVLNACVPVDMALARDNAETIKRMGALRVVGVLAHGAVDLRGL